MKESTVKYLEQLHKNGCVIEIIPSPITNNNGDYVTLKTKEVDFDDILQYTHFKVTHDLVLENNWLKDRIERLSSECRLFHTRLKDRLNGVDKLVRESYYIDYENKPLTMDQETIDGIHNLKTDGVFIQPNNDIPPQSIPLKLNDNWRDWVRKMQKLGLVFQYQFDDNKGLWKIFKETNSFGANRHHIRIPLQSVPEGIKNYTKTKEKKFESAIEKTIELPPLRISDDVEQIFVICKKGFSYHNMRDSSLITYKIDKGEVSEIIKDYYIDGKLLTKKDFDIETSTVSYTRAELTEILGHNFKLVD